VKRPAKALSLLDAGETSPARSARTRRRNDDMSAGWAPKRSRTAYEIGPEGTLDRCACVQRHKSSTIPEHPENMYGRLYGVGRYGT
jgi:hypothetical protein